jgi:hypothetical protein
LETALTDDDKLPPIDVKMGSNNTVGHIGHKITFQRPPPDPNAMWQDGREVGVMGTPPEEKDGKYLIEKLFVGAGFREDQPFEIQGVKLLIEDKRAQTLVSLGGQPPQITLWGAICRIL